jgi:hypothetical protein
VQGQRELGIKIFFAAKATPLVKGKILRILSISPQRILWQYLTQIHPRVCEGKAGGVNVTIGTSSTYHLYETWRTAILLLDLYARSNYHRRYG